MFLYRYFGGHSLVLILFLVFSSTAFGQQENPASSPSIPVVTAASSGDSVRFSAPGNITAVQVEIYALTGEKVYESTKQAGNVLDWRWQDGTAPVLNPGSYVCLVTVQSLSGKTGRKLASVAVDNQQLTLQPIEALQLNSAQTQALGLTETDTPLTIIGADQTIAATVIAHDGNDGQINRTRGALTFRVGDFFGGNDKEQMRLTADGRLGIGTSEPQARLDVAGDIHVDGFIRANKGLEFADGTVQTTGLSGRKDKEGNLMPAVTGTGTTNQVTKWTDNAGTLGDSTITEVGGHVGIGVTNPTYKLVVGPDIGPGLTTSDLTISRGSGQSVSIYAGATGAHGMNFGWDETNQRAFVNAPVQSPITFTHGGVSERMRIETNGNIGIGTSAPGSLLDVAGSINTATQYNIGGNRILSGAGTNNFFAGPGAGAVNTGADNAFFGFNAGIANAAGGGNSFFGSKAGLANTSGIDNSFFGTLAGSKNTTAPDNSFFGYIAGRDNTSGGANAFFGSGTGQNNTTGSRDSFFGRSAGERNTGGSDNSFFGTLAGFTNTNGLRNSIFGSFAAGNFMVTHTASDNSFFGYQTGFNNSSGASNAFFGSNTGLANTIGSSNSFFGAGAGAANTTENSNTFIGAATNGVAGITNATAIGANASVTQSNSLVLGSINGVNGASADTNVGVGTTAPEERLSVGGGLRIDQNNQNSGSASFALTFGHASGEGIGSKRTSGGNQFGLDFYTLFTNRMSITQGGDVGIGTTSPSARLQIRDGTGTSGSGAHVQIGESAGNADEKLIQFGNGGCNGGPCVYLGEQDADDRLVLRASTFRVKGGNWNPDIDNAIQLGQPSNRWSEVWAVNGAIQTSDARLKKGITNLRYGVSQVMQLRPVTFQWKDSSDKRTHLGLIAQEVERVMPEMIERGNDASQPLGMNYDNLIPVLIKAVQEQQRALERHQEEIKNLQAENFALSKRIVALEQSKRTTH